MLLGIFEFLKMRTGGSFGPGCAGSGPSTKGSGTHGCRPFEPSSSACTYAPGGQTARTRPATTRTPLGAARQIANAEITEQPMATQKAAV
jgi:hypothetical protein